MWKVGHSFAKRKMRELDCVVGGELAGHYYFRDFFWCDSGELAAMVALGELAAAHRKGLRFSDLVSPIDRYANTGELNFRITRKREAMERVRDAVIARQKPSAILDFDGYRIEYPEWWMSIRLSNTEPLLRLILEAANTDLLQTQRARIEALLAPFIDPLASKPC
jgi:phosphomannomutase